MFPLRVENLRFEPNGRPVLDGVDLTLDGEGISLLLGPNGAGKSVLLRTLAGLTDKHPHVNKAAAERFIDWITSSEGRAAIADYKPGGEQLFFPVLAAGR